MNTLNPLATLRARVCSNLQIQPEDPMEESLHYYMRDDDEEKYPGIDELFNKQNLSTEENPRSEPVLEISKEKYINLFKPWEGHLSLSYWVNLYPIGL